MQQNALKFVIFCRGTKSIAKQKKVTEKGSKDQAPAARGVRKGGGTGVLPP